MVHEKPYLKLIKGQSVLLKLIYSDSLVFLMFSLSSFMIKLYYDYVNCILFYSSYSKKRQPSLVVASFKLHKSVILTSSASLKQKHIDV